MLWLFHQGVSVALVELRRAMICQYLCLWPYIPNLVHPDSWRGATTCDFLHVFLMDLPQVPIHCLLKLFGIRSKHQLCNNRMQAVRYQRIGSSRLLVMRWCSDSRCHFPPTNQAESIHWTNNFPNTPYIYDILYLPGSTTPNSSCLGFSTCLRGLREGDLLAMFEERWLEILTNESVGEKIHERGWTPGKQ